MQLTPRTDRQPHRAQQPSPRPWLPQPSPQQPLPQRLAVLAGARGDEGSAAVQLAVLAPCIGLLIGLVIAVGRLSLSEGLVQAAAVDAARMASISRNAEAAEGAARTAAQTSLQGQPNTCSSYEVRVNTSGFATPVGTPAHVDVSVQCHVPLASLLPGLPGSKTVHKSATSPLDTYRERA